MTSETRKMNRLRALLIGAAALGCTSATLSGALVVLAMQNPTPIVQPALA